MLGICVSQPALKEIVHPEMKIVSSFTEPHVVPNLYEFLYSLEHTQSFFFFWRMLVNKQLPVPADFPSIEKNGSGSQWQWWWGGGNTFNVFLISWMDMELLNTDLLCSTPATLEQNYVVCELHQKVNMLFSFLRSHLKKKVIVFFACCKEVTISVVHLSVCFHRMEWV